MKRSPNLLLALLLPILAWSGAAYAQSCQNGQTLYLKTNAAQAQACGDTNCHKSNASANNISRGAGNAGAIDQALNNVSEMANVRGNLNLQNSDLDDLAQYIFFRSAGQFCPAAAPVLAASPSSVAFGSVNVGLTPTQVVTVTNSGAGNATGLTYSTLSSELTMVTKTCGTSLAAGANCSITFRYAPTNAGPDSATYTITGGGGLAIGLAGTGVAVATGANLVVSPSTANFGSVTTGTQGANVAFTVSNSGGTQATGVGFTNSNATEFPVSSNTCGTTVNAGANCTFNVRYAPTAAGADSATLTINYAGGGAVLLSMSGTGVAGGGGSGTLSMPAATSAPDTQVNVTSAPQTVTISNVGSAAVIVSSVISGNPAEFTIGSNGCSTVAAGAACAFTFTFKPTAVGARGATFTVTSNGIGNPQSIVASGQGTAGTPPPAATVDLIEYYHAAFGHYFVTYLQGEIDKLDNGTFVGWARTGLKFKAWTAPATGLSPVCRFFTTAFPPKSSHFYTPDAPECTVVKTSSVWGFEGEVFYTKNPDVAGVCPANTVPVYRMYNNGQSGAPNHRYTTDFSVRAQMIADSLGDQKWIPEGAGTIGVIMCSPP